MPDTSLTDVAAFIGAGLAALIAGLGMKRGESDKKNYVAPSPETAGIALGLLDQSIQREIQADTRRTAAACEALSDMFAGWIEADKARRQIEHERSTDHRIDDITRTLTDVLKRIDAADRNSERRHDERDEDRERRGER